MSFATIPDAVAAIAAGRFVIVVDDEDRENEGDLIMAADLMTPEAMAFLVRHTSGVVCTSVTEERADELELPLMVAKNTESQRTAFTVSVDAAHGVTTGISAADRAHTVLALADPTTKPAELVRPGHVFPLRARSGGVLVRPGHTEASVDLARMGGRQPAGVLCEIVRPDGEMARLPDLIDFAAEHGLVIITIADLVAYRRRYETLVQPVATAPVPTRHGPATAHVFESLIDGSEHVAVVFGDAPNQPAPLVRLHSECFTGDLLGSMRCDCGDQLHAAIAQVAEAGGVVVYLRGHEGRGIGLAQKLRAYELQDGGLDTVDANLALGLPVDARDHSAGAQILRSLGITAVRLLTNNPAKCLALEQAGVAVVERRSLQTRPNPHNTAYLEAKRRRLGHLLDPSPQGAAR